MRIRVNCTSLRLLRFLSFWLLCFSLGCSSKGPTRLCEGFQSYQTVEEVRTELNKRGWSAGWTERSQGTGSTDRRPPYQMIDLSGPTKLLGAQGNLTFTFYNGRLMSTRFSPRSGDDFMAALRKEGSTLPRKPGEEIVTDRRTRFRFDRQPNGSLSFTWYDPKLEDEWERWVSSYA